jgi:hypothetical protein
VPYARDEQRGVRSPGTALPWSDGDGEGLRRASILPSIGGAAVVLENDCYNGDPRSIGCGSETQKTTRAECRLGRKESGIVIAQAKLEVLSGFTWRSRTDGRCPTGEILGAVVLSDNEVRTFKESRRMVRADDTKMDGHRC